ncbi:MAG: hypothetical protein K8S54_18035 [Spirochaetia bacterium]|nr:hypothetical protein [Spirochaetia bacterium]
MQVGEILVSKGVISPDQLKKALEEQTKSGARIGDVIVQLGFASKDSVEGALK